MHILKHHAKLLVGVILNLQLTDGSLAPCQSADFNTQTNVCQIFLDASSPLGSGQTSPEPNTVHYEKNCLDCKHVNFFHVTFWKIVSHNSASLVQQCPGPVIIAPQKTLVGFVESTFTASSRQDCINECLNSKTRFNYVCSSGMFYSAVIYVPIHNLMLNEFQKWLQESSNNCILNSQSSQTQPTMLIDQDASEKVDYFEPICSPSASMSKKAKSSRPKSNTKFRVVSTYKL